MASPSSFYAVLRDRIATLKNGRPETPQPVHVAAPGASEDHGFATIGCTNAEAFGIVCRMLNEKHGRKIPNTPEGTLNRLFKKHLGIHHPALAEDAPELTGDNVWVIRETRPKLNFVGLSRRLMTSASSSAATGRR